MKRKFVTNTYLRGIDNYMLMQFEDDNLDCYSVIKKVNSIDKPYISVRNGKDVCLIKEGFYMIEYLPKSEHYEVRVFLDENKNAVSYYIDIIDKIGFEEGKGLYYDDLYLDITIDEGDSVKVWDEDELEKAIEEDDDVDKEKYDMAYDTLKNLLTQIANGSNKYINNMHKEYIENHFKI